MESRRNLDPQLWGPSAWTFMESIAEGLDGRSLRHFERFLEVLPELLPCKVCRAHSRAYIDAVPLNDTPPLQWVKDFRAHVARQKPKAQGSRLSLAILVVSLAILVLAKSLLLADSHRQ
jgi:hypothetical protein